VKILLVTPIPRGFSHHFFIEQIREEIRKYGEIKNSLLIGSIGWFWERSLKKLGHQVEVFIENKRERLDKLEAVNPKCYRWVRAVKAHLPPYHFLEKKLINQQLLKKVIEFRPEIILVTEGSNILPETLQKIKRKIKTKLVLRLGADPFIFGMEGIIRNLSGYDFIFTHLDLSSSLQRAGAKRILYYSLRADPTFHRQVELSSEEKKKLESDVCFVGLYYPERERILKEVAELKVNFKFWGSNWHPNNTSSVLYQHYQGEAWGEKMVKIYNATRIALNIDYLTYRYGGNMRLFEIPACGALEIVNRKEKISNFFKPDEEIVLFENIDDLKEKILYYLKNEEKRRKIAQQGQARVYQDHTYEQGLRYIIEEVNKSGPD
jgi:spore maturation protein CgeB